jgi:NAD(P)-dependent dehydrogenase (short-subunit alcohol dehydrogenase family)
MTAPLESRVGVAVITGAASGLGRATAIELARRGFDIVAVGPERDELHATAAMVSDAGHRGIAVQADVTDASGLQQVSNAAMQLGGASALVNNAAIYPSRPWDEISEEEWDRVLAVNLKGAFLCCRALIAPLREARGSIVNIASNTFFIGWSGLAHYVSSKGGLIGLTRALARELGSDGIRVNAVAPGAIPTRAEAINPDPARYSTAVIERQSLKRRGTPDDIAKAVAFLVGEDSSFITGQTLVVDGGWHLH